MGWDERKDGDPIRIGYHQQTPYTIKSRKKWCRGKTGVEHIPAPGYSSWVLRFTKKCRPVEPGDRSRLWSDGVWICLHEKICTKCDKHLGSVKPEDCPLRPQVVRNAP
jgi:hypothetical protein